MPEFRKFLLLGAALAGLSVLLGAFAAHGLERSISEARLLDNFNTAARYQFYHALGLIAVFLLSSHNLDNKLLDKSGWAMFLGIVLFSGSLYLYVLSGIKNIAMITPIGGMLMIVAWLLMFLAAFRAKP
ncbi:MAG: hypothetical protein CSB47_01710 [Proteobacteria bacterium]|nr:MAG: hypothetical protein CSB47_01710 [Pseudomonadota bacterium]